MKAFFKYAIVLALGLTAGLYAEQAYMHEPMSLQDDTIHEDLAAPKPEAAVVPGEPVGGGSADEELDYTVARRLGSLEGWNAFLAAHGTGVHAQSAVAELERLLLAPNAPAPSVAEVSKGASPDGKTLSGAVGPPQPSPSTDATASTPDEVPAPAARELSNAASPDAKQRTRPGCGPSFFRDGSLRVCSG